MKIAIIALLALAAVCHGELIPAARLTDWTPGTYVGVPGGIPTTRSPIVTVTADTTGVVDATSAIQTAMDSAAANSVVFLPAGTYKITGNLTPKNNMTLRGAGMSATTLKWASEGSISRLVSSDGFYGPHPNAKQVTAGATRGSTVLTLTDTTDFVVGNLIQVVRINSRNQTDSPLVVNVWGNTSGNDWVYRQKTRVTAKTSTTITIFPPLYGDMSAYDSYAAPNTNFVGGIGLEDFTADFDGDVVSGQDVGIFFEEHVGSWLKNVKVKGVTNRNVEIMDCLFFEMRGCWLDSLIGLGTNGAGLLFEVCSGSLIEDNVILDAFPSIETNSGSGNVIAYNFCFNDLAGPYFSIDSNHGPHGSFNLYEGNVANNIVSDGFFGSESHITIFRNWFTGHSQGSAVRLNRFTRLASVVGNINGGPTNDFGYNGLQYGQPNIGNGSWSGSAPPWADFGVVPGVGPGGFQELDLGVEADVVQKGNYNFFQDQVPAGESLGADPLPNSLFRSSKPTYFGSLAWPPVDPFASGLSAFDRPAEAENPAKLPDIYVRIPAGYRYVNGTDPPSDTGGGAGAPGGKKVGAPRALRALRP